MYFPPFFYLKLDVNLCSYRVFGLEQNETKLNGLVAQLVRALACHARGRGFEPHPSRHDFVKIICGFSSFGRAPPCQGGGGGFEPRNPLQKEIGHPLELFSKGQFCKNTVYLERGMPYSCFFSSYADLRISSIISRSSFSSGMSISPTAVK